MFGNVIFLRDYPYSLPTFIVGVVGLSAAVVSALFIEEVRVFPIYVDQWHQLISDQTLDKKAFKDASLNPPMTLWELVNYPGVAMVLYLYGHVMLLAFAFTAGELGPMLSTVLSVATKIWQFFQFFGSPARVLVVSALNP